MSKIDIDFKLISSEDKIQTKISGIFNSNRIVYIDNDVKTTIILDEEVIMKREGKDYILNFIFSKDKKTFGSYELTSYKVSIPLEIDTKELLIKDNYLKIEYHLCIDQEDKGIYKLELNYK